MSLAIIDLPHDILIQIFNILPTNELLGKIPAVCKTFDIVSKLPVAYVLPSPQKRRVYKHVRVIIALLDILFRF
jgi:hypothetical protein